MHWQSIVPALQTVLFNYKPLIYAGFASFLFCISVVLTKRWHGRYTLDQASGVQKVHTHPTPRVGGLAILFGLLVGLFFSDDSLRVLFKPMLIASLPAFFFGFSEDLTKRVGVTERLLASMASGVLAWWLTGVAIHRVGLWGLDVLLAYVPIALALTAVAVGGVANAINMIDGFHGLASGIALISLTSMGLIAYGVGDTTLAKLVAIIICVNLGFLLVNFPYGKIFLGDGGAYLLGFLLAWTSILLVHRNLEVNPWTVLLILAMPVTEALFTIYRRLRRERHPGMPDRLHLHSLIKSRFSRKKLTAWPETIQNASVSPVMWVLAAVPSTLAVFTWRSQTATMGALLLSIALYFATYRSTIRVFVLPRKKRPIRTGV